MSYGTIKVNTITFTNNGVDQSVTVSGIVASTSGNLTVTGTVSGSTASFANGTFNTFSGGTCTITSGVLASGTASNPAISFNGDVNTGIYSPNADEIGFTTNGQARFIIDANGQLEASSAGSASSPTYTFANDVDTGLYSPGTNQLALSAGGVERARIDSSGRLLIGTSSAISTNSVTAGVEVHGTSTTNGASLSIAIFNNDSSGGQLILAKSRSATVAAGTIIQNNDDLGQLVFNGDDGTDLNTPAARIQCFVDGTPGANDMPGRLVFSTTADGASSPTERMRITSAGLVGIGTSSPGALFHLGGNTDNAVQAILAQGADLNFRLVSINKSASNVSGSEVSRFGIRYATGTDDSSGIQFFRGNTSNEGHLGIYTGGTTRVYVAGGTGNVGIGTTTVNTTLEVLNSSTPIIRVGDGTRHMELRGGSTTQNAAIGTNYAGGFDIIQNGSAAVTIDSSKRVLVGTSTSRTIAGFGSALQLEGATNYQSASASIIHNRADNGGPEFRFAKSRGTAQGSVSIVASGDILGRIMFYGADGSVMTQAANISVEVDGTPGVTDMPGRLMFSTTPDGTGSPVERMRITSGGNVGIGTTSPNESLEVAGNIHVSGADRSIFNRSNNALTFGTNNVERARIDSSGRLLVGTSTSVSQFGVQPQIQSTGTSGAGGYLGLTVFNTVADSAPSLVLGHSKGGSVGTYTASVADDLMGGISFTAANGTDMRRGAFIGGYADGAWGTNDHPGRLVFSTTADGAASPTERMRISNNGQLDSFSTGAAYAFRTESAASVSSVFLLGLHSATQNYTTGTSCFVVRTNGNVENTNNSYTGISDVKLKENIVDASSQWGDIKALQVRNYNFKPETGHQTHTQIGLIAQEVELVSPGLVSESPDRDEDGNDLGTVTKSVNYSVLYMKAVKALQEAMERIETLEQRLNDAGIN